MQEMNIYCDESCHLEHDDSDIMVLGAVYCARDKVAEINQRIKEIKNNNGVHSDSEIKWNKVSNLKLNLYKDIVNYFFDDDDLFFRAVIANKQNLSHEKHNQTHDDWYYKMYFLTLRNIISPKKSTNIFIDIKDTNSAKKISKLKDILRNNKYDFNHKIVKNMQPIRSHEVQIMQLTDILIGALSYYNRFQNGNQGKVDVIELIKHRSGYNLTQSTLTSEQKFNVFRWDGSHE